MVKLGLWRGAFTCVGWQVTLCDPIRQATLRGFEMGFIQRVIPFSYLTVHANSVRTVLAYRGSREARAVGRDILSQRTPCSETL